MKESFLKVGGLFLPITSLLTFTRFLTSPFRKVRPTSALKSFYHRFYIFGIITHLLMDKQFPWLAPKDTSKYNSWGMNGPKYWRFVIVAYLQPNKLKKKPNFSSIYYISCFFFAGKQYMKTHTKVPVKVQRITGTSSRMST